MEYIRSHLQITTTNDIGAERRARTLNYWKKIDLSPEYVSTSPILEYTNGLTHDVIRKILLVKLKLGIYVINKGRMDVGFLFQ